MLEKAEIAMKALLKVSGESLERRKESWWESLHLIREYKNNHEENVGRNMGNIGPFDELTGRNEHFIGN